MIILKVTKKQGFTLSLEDTFLEKSKGVPQAVLSLSLSCHFIKLLRVHFCGVKQVF